MGIDCQILKIKNVRKGNIMEKTTKTTEATESRKMNNLNNQTTKNECSENNKRNWKEQFLNKWNSLPQNQKDLTIVIAIVSIAILGVALMTILAVTEPTSPAAGTLSFYHQFMKILVAICVPLIVVLLIYREVVTRGLVRTACFFVVLLILLKVLAAMSGADTKLLDDTIKVVVKAPKYISQGINWCLNVLGY